MTVLEEPLVISTRETPIGAVKDDPVGLQVVVVVQAIAPIPRLGQRKTGIRMFPLLAGASVPVPLSPPLPSFPLSAPFPASTAFC